MPNIRDKKPQIVRAWFDTVLNPLIRGLQSAVQLVHHGDFTWRSHASCMASVAAARSYIMTEHMDNLDQFLSFYPGLVPGMDLHDERVAALGKQVAAYYSDLVELPQLHELLRRVNAPDGMAEYVAEYVVNGLTLLPSYYGAASFWNAHQAEFIGLKDSPTLRHQWESLQRAKADFEQSATKLLASIKSVRGELSLEHDVPIVMGIAS
jgi:hypothetical protein